MSLIRMHVTVPNRHGAVNGTMARFTNDRS
jgi:hypothetical protein